MQASHATAVPTAEALADSRRVDQSPDDSNPSILGHPNLEADLADAWPGPQLPGPPPSTLRG